MDSIKNKFEELIIEKCNSPFVIDKGNSKKSFDTNLLKRLLEKKGCKLERIGNKNNAWRIENAEKKTIFWSHGFSNEGKSFDQDTLKVLLEAFSRRENVLYCEIIRNDKNEYSVWATSELDKAKKDSRSQNKEFTIVYLGNIEGTLVCENADFADASRMMVMEILNHLK